MKRTMPSVRRQARRRVVARRRSRTHFRHHRPRVRFGWYQGSGPSRRGSTLLALVHEVQQRVRNDAEVVRVVRWLVNSGAVVLTGNFAGQRF